MPFSGGTGWWDGSLGRLLGRGKEEGAAEKQRTAGHSGPNPAGTRTQGKLAEVQAALRSCDPRSLTGPVLGVECPVVFILKFLIFSLYLRFNTGPCCFILHGILPLMDAACWGPGKDSKFRLGWWGEGLAKEKSSG